MVAFNSLDKGGGDNAQDHEDFDNEEADVDDVEDFLLTQVSKGGHTAGQRRGAWNKRHRRV